MHATIAGVALGLLTRVRPDPDEHESPAERLEHRIRPMSAGLAVPFFALMSAGVAIGGGEELIKDPIVLGIVLGLVVGKTIGVLAGAWSVTKLTRAELAPEISWRDVFGVAVLSGHRLHGVAADRRSRLRRCRGRACQDRGARRIGRGRCVSPLCCCVDAIGTTNRAAAA